MTEQDFRFEVDPHRAVGKSENPVGPVLMWGHNLPSPVEIVGRPQVCGPTIWDDYTNLDFRTINSNDLDFRTINIIKMSLRADGRSVVTYEFWLRWSSPKYEFWPRWYRYHFLAHHSAR